MSLKMQQKRILKELTEGQIRRETLDVLIEAVSLLNSINDKLDKFSDLEKKIEAIIKNPVVIRQEVNPITSNEIPDFKTNEPAFIPTIHKDDMTVRGDKAVKTKTKKRNLSGAAKNLKKTRSDEHGK